MLSRLQYVLLPWSWLVGCHCLDRRLCVCEDGDVLQCRGPFAAVSSTRANAAHYVSYASWLNPMWVLMPSQVWPFFHATGYPVASFSSQDPSVKRTSPGLSLSASLFASSRSSWTSLPLKDSGSSSRTVHSVSVTLGLYRNRSVGRIRGNQATFDNSQRNNLRSCMWVFGGSVGEDVRFFFLSSLRRGENPSLISASARVRSGDPDRFSSRRSVGAMRVGRT